MFYRTGQGYLLRFPDLADYEIASEGYTVTCAPALNVPEATTSHVYLNQILPLILSRQGKIVMHGSAVAGGGLAFGFLGTSGQGKSTLAASFALNGCPFLTDDGLVLEPEGPAYLAMPSYPSLRLWQDSEEALLPGNAQKCSPVHYSQKSRFVASSMLNYCDQPKPLKALYVLGDENSAEVAIRPLDPTCALFTLLYHSYILDICDRPSISAHFNRLARLANEVACFELNFPRRYETLPRTVEAIRAHAGVS
jgi:hypothetical protein